MTLTKLMAVEDDPDIRRILELALGTFGGFQLTLCESGEAALTALQQERPDLILLDVMMPGLDGPGTLHAIRAQPALATIPVVFLTAKLQPGEIASWTALGALAVIGKPFDPLTLPNELRRLYGWRRWLHAFWPARSQPTAGRNWPNCMTCCMAWRARPGASATEILAASAARWSS